MAWFLLCFAAAFFACFCLLALELFFGLLSPIVKSFLSSGCARTIPLPREVF